MSDSQRTSNPQLWPIEREELIRWHRQCSQGCTMQDDFNGAAMHNRRATQLEAGAAHEPKTGLERARDVVAEVVRGLGGEARVGATLALNAIAEAMIGTRASEPPLDGDERARREQLADRLSWPQPIRADLDAAADIIRSTLTKSARPDEMSGESNPRAGVSIGHPFGPSGECIPGYWQCSNCKACNHLVIHHTSCPQCRTLRLTQGENCER
jgi:hypothetical protein